MHYLLENLDNLPKRMLGWLRYHKERRHWIAKEDWNPRVRIAKECPDNAWIQRCDEAGVQENGWIRMHNGLLVESGGYYGEGSNPLLTENLGVHEPQEELIFGETLKQIPDGSNIMELGAYWGFYSMWFLRSVPSSKAYLIEGEVENLEVGKRNFAKNQLEAKFLHAFLSNKTYLEKDQTPLVTVDQLFVDYSLSKLTLLHADIQSNELKMLEGAVNALANKRIQILFISTHSNSLHYACRKFLSSFGYHIAASIDLIDSYSFDGLLVAHLPTVVDLSHVNYSLRSQA